MTRDSVARDLTPAVGRGSASFAQRSHEIPTRDGSVLAADVFAPRGAKPVYAALILNGATGVPRGFYRRFAAHAATRGVVTVTYDYRGLGDSLKSSVARSQACLLDWAQRDFPAILDWTRAAYPQLPLFGLGHSVGGQLFGLTPHSRLLTGLIGVAAQSGYWRLSSTPVRRLLTWYALVPALTRLFGYLPGWAGVGESLPRQVALDWARWCRSPDFFVDSRSAPLETHFANYAGAVLWLSIEHDAFASAAAVRWLADRFENAAVERRVLRGADFDTGPIGHFKFFTPRYQRGWDQLLQWIGQTKAAHPL